MKCKYNNNTHRCVKIKENDKDKDKGKAKDIPSEFCKYNNKTGFCILKDKPPLLKKKKKTVYKQLKLENICDEKCRVIGLGETTISDLETIYPIPKEYYLSYGVLKNGVGVVYDHEERVHEIFVKDNIMVINQGSFTFNIIPYNN